MGPKPFQILVSSILQYLIQLQFNASVMQCSSEYLRGTYKRDSGFMAHSEFVAVTLFITIFNFCSLSVIS